MKGKILSNEYIFAGNSAYFKYEKNDFLGDFTLKIGDFVYFTSERNIARKICPFALKDKFYKSTEVDDSDVKKAKIFGILSSFMLIANAIFNENIFYNIRNLDYLYFVILSCGFCDKRRKYVKRQISRIFQKIVFCLYDRYFNIFRPANRHYIDSFSTYGTLFYVFSL